MLRFQSIFFNEKKREKTKNCARFRPNQTFDARIALCNCKRLQDKTSPEQQNATDYI